jgi:hypothetical protein
MTWSTKPLARVCTAGRCRPACGRCGAVQPIPPALRAKWTRDAVAALDLALREYRQNGERGAARRLQAQIDAHNNNDVEER